ncbi:MAG: biopolymer transport protein ExbB [Flavobacteriales bacterium]|jgi:biopolymer transport protein ExbB
MITMKKVWVGLAAAGALTLSGIASAQADKASSLEELLSMVKSAKISETKEYRARETAFKKNKSSQGSLLRQIENSKRSEEARSEALEASHKALDEEIQKMRALRDEKLGSLKELFGHLTSTAGDLRSNIDSSIVSAQYPGRTEFLTALIEKMNSETKLPTTEELEKLWYELQFEIAESGKVVSFTAEVADPQGNRTERNVVRVGNYNLVSDGKYLEYNDKGGSLSELARQPKKNSSAELQSATSGFVKVGIDPTGPAGGKLLKLLVDTPTLEDKWHEGGVVGYVITGVGGVAFLIFLWRLLVLSGVSGKVNKQLKAKSANTNNPLGRMLKVAEDNPNIDTESLELKLEEAALKETPAIESMLQTVKIISMVAPLLGLLGTVTGMITVFQAITIYGAGDPKAMAGGISGALVTTVLGLYVAIPTVLAHTFLNAKAKRITHILEEQSAGIIASKSDS